MLCDYGCGQIATHQFKNGKWCCSESYTKCSEIRKKNSKKNKGHKGWNKGLTKDTNTILNEISKKMKGRIPWNKNLKGCFSLETLEKISIKSKSQTNRRGLFVKGSIPWNKNLKGCFSPETNKRISMKNSGKTRTDEVRNRMSISDKNNWKNNKTRKENLRRRMLNGGALKAIKSIKKISKPEITLRNMVKEIFPDCEFQYGIFNYSIDIAIIEYKIAIEYDGYYHFNIPENIEYHKQRQNRIEDEGWTFYRVTMFDKFPTLEEVKENINNLIIRRN